MDDKRTPVEKLREAVDTFDSDTTQRIDRPQISIICGDDGKQIAFRGTCPKCGSDQWIPAAITSAQMEALQKIGIIPFSNEPEKSP